MKFHQSRWCAWPGYLLLILLLILATWLNDRAIDVPAYVCAGVALILFIFLELFIRKEQLEVGEKNIVFSHGFLKKETKTVSFASIAEVHLVQTGVQRLLHYGDILLRTSVGEIVMHKADEVQMIERDIAYQRKR